MITVFFAPQVVDSVKTAQPILSEDFDFTLEIDHALSGATPSGIDKLGSNYTQEGESMLNITCKGIYYFVRDTRLYECVAEGEQISLDPEIADDVDQPILRMNWSGVEGSGGEDVLLQLDDLDDIPEEFDIDSPEVTGRYNLEFEGFEGSNLTSGYGVESILIEEIESDDYGEPDIEQNFITRKDLNDNLVTASTVYFNLLLVLSIWFAGFSVIMKLNKEHKEDKFSKKSTQKELYVKTLSAILILGIVLEVAVLVFLIS